MKKSVSILLFLLILIDIILFLGNYFSPIISPASNHMYGQTPVSALTLTPTPTLDPPVTIGLVGDLGLGRHITSTARAKNDFFWSFQNISPWLIENDFNLANLESPIINNCPEGKTGTFTFCGDTRFLPYLQQNKFIFNLNNNHILNYGQDGLNQTKSFLDSQSTPFFYDNFLIQNINGLSFGFLGYDFITYPNTNPQVLIDAVHKHHQEVDYLIISIHWGNEYLPAAEKWRINLAHDLIDAGADIIHGHHPHVWQPQEIYQGKPIFYSLGNFIFDQSWSYETSHTQIVRLTLTETEIKSIDYFPVEIKSNSQPWIMSGST